MQDLARPSSARAAEAPVAVPEGYTGPLALPGTNRHIYWTGRVAIGLRYEREQRGVLSQSGHWIQSLMLARRPS
jgi:hypothetical protein